jgi:oligopeptidase B
MVRCVTKEHAQTTTHTSEVTSPPAAKRVPTERTHHGDTVIDDYEWLRDKDDPDTLAYLKAENAHTETVTAGQGPLRESIFTEIKSRTQETDLSVPARKHGWWYYSRTIEGSQYALHCRAPAGSQDRTPPTLDAATPIPDEQILLDGNALAEGSDFFALGTVDVTSDGRLLAYSVDLTGDERFTIHVKDLESGELLTDEISGAFYGSAWSLDGSTLFYLTVDDAWRPYRVWRHRLGTAAGDDVCVYEESDQRFWVHIGLSRSDRFIMLGISSQVTSETRVLESARPMEEFRVVVPRRDNVEYSVEHAVVAGEDRFLILHNSGAANFALAQAPVHDADPGNWEEVIAHDPQVRLLSVDAFASHAVVNYRREGLTGLRILPLDTDGYGDPHVISFHETLFSAGPGTNPEFDSPTFRYGYTSFLTPASVFDYDIANRRSTLLKQTPVLGDFDPTAYEQFREWAVADDGARIPISVVARKGVARDGTAPAVLYGYGAYEISVDPAFSISRLSLLDRGVVFAVAHVRGGGEMGRAWYEQGKLLHKINTFTDFVACARRLVALGWTNRHRMVAEGGSAGGLLMGAVANLAPQEFAGFLAEVPFVDTLTSMLNPSLPLTVIEWEEWGDPLHSAEVYEYMKSYSPYENVRDTEYPPILAMSSLNDTRVLYVEPAKWVAKLRRMKAQRPSVLLKTELGAGHAGPSGRYDAWRDRAFALAWVIDAVGASHEP